MEFEPFLSLGERLLTQPAARKAGAGDSKRTP